MSWYTGQSSSKTKIFGEKENLMTDLMANPAAWAISEELRKIIAEAIREKSGACIISFRDPNYSAERGGFHPVEIMVSGSGEIQYITDFAFVGIEPHSELVKEIDFDFSCGAFQHFCREYPISEGRELFMIWMSNFTMYHRMGVYEISIEEIEEG